MGAVDKIEAERADPAEIVLRAFASTKALSAIGSEWRMRLAYQSIAEAILDRVEPARELLEGLSVDADVGAVIAEQATIALEAIDDSVIQEWHATVIPDGLPEVSVPLDAVRHGGFRFRAVQSLLLILEPEIAAARVRAAGPAAEFS